MYVHVQYYHRGKILKEIWIFVLIHSTVTELLPPIILLLFVLFTRNAERPFQ